MTFKQRTGGVEKSGKPAPASGNPLVERNDLAVLSEYQRQLKFGNMPEIVSSLKSYPEDVVFLGTFLKDAETTVRWRAARCLSSAALEMDISAALPALINALSDPDVKTDAGKALENAISNDKNRENALDSLLRALLDPDRAIWQRAFDILAKAAETGDHDTRVSLTNAIISYIETPIFTGEAERNSVLYVEMFGYLQQIIDKLQIKEAV